LLIKAGGSGTVKNYGVWGKNVSECKKKCEGRTPNFLIRIISTLFEGIEREEKEHHPDTLI